MTSGKEDEPPPPLAPPIVSSSPAWRASTGQHDLSQRQIHLRHEMLKSGSNIKPLLENAKEVERRLEECMEELRVLLKQVEAVEK
ncbi:uncharacterized protein ARMOST_14800 [Armillaria ostoyae]|uniref:REM-1 domain-containing protein n=1 Tax=Armillaria ostoyae TaxID=47428 RepID=A0A284RRK5_ARMOS|nr:uncharacterized protein ARMOST_14800 [Armillaria ostoyae]